MSTLRWLTCLLIYSLGSVAWADLKSVGSTSPAGTTTAVNATNGSSFSLNPVITTGAYAQASSTILDLTCSVFTGNVYNDCASTFGYNYGEPNYTIDPFAGGYTVESNYEALTGNTGGSGTATSVTTTTLTDTNQSWPVNSWAGFTLYNTTQGLSAKIVSNTATVITVATTMTGQTGTPAYQIFNDTMETYIQYQQSDNGVSRSIRPFFFTFDRGIAHAQAQLGTNAAITITAATNASPASFTTSVNHGLTTGMQVKLASLAGGTWGTKLNGVQLNATVTGATTFTLPVNSTGFGTYTASSGTETAEPVMATTRMLASPTAGFQLLLPSWNPTSGDVVAQFAPSSHILYAAPFQPNLITLQAGLTNFSQLFFQYNNSNQMAIDSACTGCGQVLLYNNGAGATQALAWQRGSSTIGTTTFGPTDSYSTVLVAISNNGGTASIPLLHMRQATSQTGNFIESYKQDDATLVWKIDSNGTYTRPAEIANGTISVSGCSLTSALGGQTAGKYNSGTTGTCTVTVTLPTAPNGWTCNAHDTTTVADLQNQTAFTTTSCTISGTTVSGDVVTFNAVGW